MTRRYFDSADYEKNHIPAALGYLVFFIPLIVDAHSPLNRFCANQGLLGLIAYVIVSVAFGILTFLLGWIPIIGWLIALIGKLAKIAIAAITICYGWKVYCGKAEALPYVGHIQLIK